MVKYKNGNATVTLSDDGTRVVECDGELQLEYPLNLDVRLSSKCAFGMNPKTGKAVCEFCHESATTDGRKASFADIDEFFDYAKFLPAGTEIAVGANEITNELYYFLNKCQEYGLICNITVNQGLLNSSTVDDIKFLIAEERINGLGISYRSHAKDIPQVLLDYPNTVVHVIEGIDSIDDVKHLATKGVKKILVLGEKDFGFNLGKINLVSASHKKWYYEIHELFKLFDVVSFDNLSVARLGIKRFVKNWNEVYQGEHSFYVNLVSGTFSPSSRSPETVSIGNIKEYFSTLNRE